MNAIDRLVANYARQVRLPWSRNMSGKQRVWFAVFPPSEERRIRARLPQFEALTLEANHGWTVVDLTDLLPQWLATHEYRESIFAEPEYFTVGNELEDLAVELSRWYDVDFFFIHAASGQKKFTGAIKRNNSLQFMLDFIEKTSDVRFEVKENVVRVYNR